MLLSLRLRGRERELALFVCSVGLEERVFAWPVLVFFTCRSGLQSFLQLFHRRRASMEGGRA